MRSPLVATLWIMGCTGGAGKDTGPTGECPSDPRHLESLACLESTAPPPEDTGGYGGNVAGQVPGTVSELGAASSVPGSEPVGGFPPCDDVEHAIRLVDDAGETWTFGWSVEGSADAMPGSLGVGTDVTLTYEWVFTGFDVDRSVVVADAVGPRLVFAGPGVDPALLAGLAVKFDFVGETCVREVDGQEFDEHPVSFDAADTLVLYSGESGVVQLSDYSLDVIVPGSWTITGCADGCSRHDWVGWD